MNASVGRSVVEPYLERILESAAFRTSPKCQAFLRFVVRHTLHDPGEPLTEILIAEQVFARGGRYNPSEDSLVRVKASEVRRRLSQYYAEQGEPDEWRIELPLGGYVPRFTRKDPLPVAARPVPAVSVPAARIKAPRFLMAVGVAALALGLSAALAGRLFDHRSATQEFWAPVMNATKPVLIYLPMPAGNYVRADDSSEGFVSHPDRVGVGAALAAMRFVDLCVRTGKPYVVKAGADLSFSDLRDHPAILFGAFSSQWPAEMNNEYRFRLERGGGVGRIVDSQTAGREWVPSGSRPDGWADIDYAIAARVFVRKTNQTVIIASGTTTFGTQAAAEFLTNADSLKDLARMSSKPLSDVNFQVVLKTKVIGNTPGFPSIVATHFWR